MPVLHKTTTPTIQPFLPCMDAGRWKGRYIVYHYLSHSYSWNYFFEVVLVNQNIFIFSLSVLVY